MTKAGINSYVLYRRVSSAEQGRSGLGLEAQLVAASRFVETTGGKIVASFVEVQSGKSRARPQLAEALRECRLRGVPLLVARLDRFSRRLDMLTDMRRDNIRLVSCDDPSGNQMMQSMRMVFAEEELRLISERTKAALAAAKARGVVLGSPRNLSNQTLGNQRSASVRSANANARSRDLVPIIEQARHYDTILSAPDDPSPDA
jgi:DNA invertase Pin-like site-specific DNA recombinase